MDLLPRVSKLSVKARTESDHLPLSLRWVSDQHSLRQSQDTHLDAEIEIGRKKIKWCGTLNDKFCSWAKSKMGKEIYDKMCILYDEGNFSLDCYTQLISNLIPILFRENDLHPKSTRSKGWFDHDCILAKRKLTWSFKKFQKSPNIALKAEVQFRKKRIQSSSAS